VPVGDISHGFNQRVSTGITPQVKIATTARASMPTASQKGQPDSSHRPPNDETVKIFGHTPNQVTTAIFQSGGAWIRVGSPKKASKPFNSRRE
jgi:hypothetical protein